MCYVVKLLDSGRRQWRDPPPSQFPWCLTKHQALNFNGAWSSIFSKRCASYASYDDHTVVSETLSVPTTDVPIIQLVC